KPKRGSMDARVSASSGRPGDCTVSCTSCGASLETCGSDASRCTQACGPRVLLRSESLARSSAKPGGLRDLDRKPRRNLIYRLPKLRPEYLLSAELLSRIRPAARL